MSLFDLLPIPSFMMGSTGVLVLQPDSSGRTYAGFRDGKSLHATAQTGDTVGVIMERFNTYRGPDQQITRLWNVSGEELPFSTPVVGNIVAIVRRVN